LFSAFVSQGAIKKVHTNEETLKLNGTC